MIIKKSQEKGKFGLNLYSLSQNEFLILHFEMGFKCYKKFKVGEPSKIFQSLRISSETIRNVEKVYKVIS